MKQSKLSKALLALGLSSLVGVASAMGSQMFYQDAAQLGDNFAGAVSHATDASIGWYNPAGLTQIKKAQMSFGTIAEDTDLPFKGTVATYAINTNANGIRLISA